MGQLSPRRVLAGLILGLAPVAVALSQPSGGTSSQPSKPGLDQQDGEQASDWEQVKALAESDLLAAGGLAVELLDAGQGAPTQAVQVQAFELGQAILAAHHREAAAELQVALQRRVRAEWSVINAALTLGDLGRIEEADRLLGEQLELEPRDAALWNHRGLLRLGNGETRLARRHLARAVRYGSQNAGLSMARLLLLAGDLQAARAAFRPGLAGPEPHAWALRGWAATQLVDAPH
ncbi:hypothetical protein [Engelhardtia mirabilis]|uniref:Uncharacterized protein n=1 Tax=Engelhardtia mirabilis TaxID=2528011 RepID=A0A518BKR3_9BACT|nr:hypothetical protein Pla133_26440 [Planctomycetes bacterium Pla133]QDV01882.1 hypothetical protein Pla86_26430 [Planctomycetes bacterium Pla86]